jgi:hypothetical protein
MSILPKNKLSLKDKCEIYTKKGQECPFTASKYLKTVGKQVCGFHDKICKERYKKYKNICSKIWNLKCLPQMTDSKIKEIKKFAEICHYQRIHFNQNCCNNSIDNSHLSAVKKMEKIIEACDNEQLKRDIDNETYYSESDED